MSEVAGEIVALCAVVGVGILVGRLSWKGVSLGTSGVVFVALAAGNFGFSVPEFAGVAGVVLFVYCLGLGAGPTFSQTFMKSGFSLAVLALAMIASGAAAAWCTATWLGLGPGLAAGLFAGALTSTPALAAATEQLPTDPEVAVGFGIAYPFGVVVVILFVQLAPRIVSWLPGKPAEDSTGDSDHISRMLIEITNPGLAGKRLRELTTVSEASCQIPRILNDGRLEPVPPGYQVQLGHVLLAIGQHSRLKHVAEAIGRPCNDEQYVLDVEGQRRRVVVTSHSVAGKTLKELHLLSRFGVTITRVMRQDIEFVPNVHQKLQIGDALTATGETSGLEKFVKFAGHRERAADESDLAPLSIGIALGVLLGSVRVTFMGESISAGMAGGPLIVGLIQGQLGQLGIKVGRLPRAARILMSELGLALFLAQAGSTAGQKIVPVLAEYGAAMCIAALIVVLTPLIVGQLFARFVLGLETLETLGGICGAMTSTPGLGAITSTSESSVPATSCAAVYPMALIMVTVVAPLLISLLS